MYRSFGSSHFAQGIPRLLGLACHWRHVVALAERHAPLPLEEEAIHLHNLMGCKSSNMWIKRNFDFKNF
jgi:hypothetical protein